MTVREWIEESKKNVTGKDIIIHLEGLADYGRDTYGKSLDEEYDGDYENENEDPWVKDILYCNMAVQQLLLVNELKIAFKKCINHIENFEEDMANQVLESIGIDEEFLIQFGLK